MRCGWGKVSSRWRGKANLFVSGQCVQCFSRWPVKPRCMRIRSHTLKRCAHKAHVQMCTRRRTASRIPWGSRKSHAFHLTHADPCFGSWPCSGSLVLNAYLSASYFLSLHCTSHTLYAAGQPHCNLLTSTTLYAWLLWVINVIQRRKQIHISRSSRWCGIGFQTDRPRALRRERDSVFVDELS